MESKFIPYDLDVSPKVTNDSDVEEREEGLPFDDHDEI